MNNTETGMSINYRGRGPSLPKTQTPPCDERHYAFRLPLRMETIMSTTTRRLILRTDAAFLLAASAGGMWSDLCGAFLARGHVAPVLATAPHAAIGFVEAHGLAFILGVLLWRAAPQRTWHLTAAAIHALLGTANLVFWQIFVAADMLPVGYITTCLHWLFVALHLGAVVAKPATLRSA
jgi:hypothetical protein